MAMPKQAPCAGSPACSPQAFALGQQKIMGAAPHSLHPAEVSKRLPGRAGVMQPAILQRQNQRPVSATVEKRPGPPAYRPQVNTHLPIHSVGAQSAQPAVQRWLHRPGLPPKAVQPTNSLSKPGKCRRIQTPSIQRYSQYTGPEFGGPGKLSEGQNYFIPDGNTEMIYATAPPRNSIAHPTAGQITKGSKTYDPYISTLFFKDCLHTAEEIINGANLEDGFGGPGTGDFSKVSATGETFGVGESENIQVVRKNSLGNNANPGLGQAYVIVNTKWPKGVSSPYHAAGVVAVDGNDRITLEVFAGTTHGVTRDQQGTYAMYTTGTGSGDKFHEHWKARYFGHFSLTTVIEQY